MTHLTLNRRDLMKSLAVTVGSFAASSNVLSAEAISSHTPSYLADLETDYAQSPHDAALQWFRAAKFGLFIHYGLYSLLGGEWDSKQVTNSDKPVAEWIQYHGKIPVAEYAKLKDRFTAERFDADAITDLALAANMKYINITTRHHDSFCLFRTNETDFNSVNSPAGRDLVGELAEACQKKGIGLFLYYSHGRDWKHPHAPTNPDWGVTARPRYEQFPKEYVPYSEVDVTKYADFMERQITELLTQYGPIAGIWLDGEGVLKAYSRIMKVPLPEVCEMMQMERLYKKINKLQPQCLISYKQGVTGTEDFITPERESFGLENIGKPLEINTTLQAHSWGYDKFTKQHKSVEEIWETLETAGKLGANLLLNTGPKGDGSIVPAEEQILKTIGRRIHAKGFPLTQR